MDDTDSVTLVERARRFAALSGPFDPVTLIESLGPVTAAEAADVAVDLASACDTSDPVRWLMRGSVRRKELNALSEDGALGSSIAWRREHARDDATDDLLAALEGTGSYSEEGVSVALHEPPDREPLTRMAVALDRAGAHAPAGVARDAVRSAVGRADAGARAQAMLRRGFSGREAELARAAAWLSSPQTGSPITALFVNGPPGIGKSMFIDEVARRAAESEPPRILVRLDFERGGLDVQDRVGLALEITRQIAGELGEDAAALRSARLAAAAPGATSSPYVKSGYSRARIPAELTRVLGESLRASGRPVLLVLDTVEVLRGRGETHPIRLFEALDELCDRGLRPLSVIAAGRGEPLESIPDRIGERMELGGLDDDSADRFLGRFDISPETYPRIREVADGIPLVLRLGALAVSESGVDALEGVTGRRERAATHLYRSLLSRFGDETLRALAHPGLLVRRITPALIADVLAPAAGHRGMSAAEAVRAFDALTAQHWLVESDAVAGWVRHRPDVRKALLESIYDAEKPARTARLNRAAAKWFEHRGEPFAPFEAAYHHLQAMRSGDGAPELSNEVLRHFDDETLSELPDVARDVVSIARGDRSSRYRGTAASPGSVDHATAARELAAVLERSDLREAEYVYARSFEQSPVDPTSPEADVARSYLWRSGRWAEALEDFDPRRYFAGRFHDGSPTTTLANLEMWAESDFATLAAALASRSELGELAAGLRRRALGGSLADGALGFALRTVDAPREKQSWSMADPVVAAGTVWGPTIEWRRGTAAPAVVDALAMQSGRVASQVATAAAPPGPDLSTPAGAARLLAGATPYVSVVQAYRTFRSLRGDSALADHLDRTHSRLRSAGRLPPEDDGDGQPGPSASAETTVENLATRGLLAEWAGAAAFALRRPDLRLIALSAERWRRTCAGDWAYPTPAPADSWRRRPDATIADRVAQLRSRDACLAELDLWGSGMTDPQTLLAKLRSRYPAADRTSRGTSADAAAVTLLDHDVPAAFVPAMAVLASTEGKKRK